MNHLHKFLMVATAAFFIVGSAFAQNSGTVTNHAFALGKGAGTTGYTSLLCGSAQLAVGQSAADPICKTITGDVTISAAGATAIGATKVTSAMLNADVFSTAHTWAGQQSFVAPILGTPASGVGTNLTGTAAGLTAGNVTTNANLTGPVTSVGNATTITANAVTLAKLATQAANTTLSNATSGAAVPTAFAMPSCSTASSALKWTTDTGFGCNSAITASAVPVGGITGLGTGVGTALAINVGSAGAPVTNGGALGTPSSGVATNLTGLPLTSGVTGTLPIANGGTNDTGTAWTTFAPALSCGTATFTLNSARWKTLGKTVFLSIDFNILTLGTCTTIILATLPITPQSGTGWGSRESAIAGFGVGATISAGSTSMPMTKMDLTNFAVSQRIQLGGVFESQ